MRFYVVYMRQHLGVWPQAFLPTHVRSKSAHMCDNLPFGFQNNENGILSLEEKITSFMKMAGLERDDQLATFTWSPERLATFTKKEARAYDPSTIIRLRDEVILRKRNEIWEANQKTESLRKEYRVTSEYTDLAWYLNYLDLNPECREVYRVTRLANDMLSKGGNSDGGFEKDILEPIVLSQWLFPLLDGLGLLSEHKGGEGLIYVEKYVVYKCKAETEVVSYQTWSLVNPINPIKPINPMANLVSRYLAKEGQLADPLLIFYPGLYYVMRFANTMVKKVTYKSAETDLTIYDPKSQKVVARGEVKSNYNDVPHADFQHRRNWLMLTGDVDGDTPGAFSEYLPDEVENVTITRYLAEAGNYESPLFSQSDFSESLCNFIITKPQVKVGQLNVSSKVATQVTHWLFSSAKTPQSYIQGKIDALLDGLHFRDWLTIEREASVYVIH